MVDDGFGCCGGSDTVPQHHTSDCPTHPWTDRPGENCLLGTCHHVAALTTARADGYAEAVADVVAWLRGQARRHSFVIAIAVHSTADGIEAGKHAGAHVGAAKKGGEP